MYKHIKIENFKNDYDIKVISLNRPQVKNAFHPEMISEITEVFSQFQLDKKIKAVVIKGEGTHFCAGADLNWMKEMIAYAFEKNIEDSEKLWEMFDSILNCSIPVIGVVQGAVYGGALGLLACCDYVIAEEHTQFCFSEVKLGLAPAVISSFILRKVKDGFVRGLMLSAEVFSAETSLQMGLIHKIITELENSDEIIQTFSKNGIEAMRETKKLLNQINLKPDWIKQKILTTTVISERRVSIEAQERLKKFIDKK